MDPRRVDRLFRWPVTLAALATIPLVAVHDPGEPPDARLQALDWLIWSVFAAEAAVSLRVAPDRGRWLRSHPLEVAIVVLTFPPVATVLAVLRVARLLPLLRLARLAAVARASFSVQGVRYAALLALLTALAGGEAYATLEGGSVFQGVYWALTTMTTVGYGDVLPTKDATKAIAMAIMVVGVGFVAVVTGAIAERFVARDVQEERSELDRIEQLERTVLARLDALEERISREP